MAKKDDMTRITSAEFGDFNYQQYLEWIFVEGQGKAEHIRNMAVARTEANRPRAIEGLNHYAKVYGLSVEELGRRIRELDAQKKTILQIHRILQEEALERGVGIARPLESGGDHSA